MEGNKGDEVTHALKKQIAAKVREDIQAWEEDFVPRTRARLKKAEEVFPDVAKTYRTFLDALLAQEFTRDEAMSLLKDFANTQRFIY
jgi:hypothetical protein